MSKFVRQLDIINQEELEFPIHVIGAGGIGSWTTLLLAKMGCQNIKVYDDDIVEEHNVVSQFFQDNQLGQKKIDALHDNVLAQTGIEIVPAPQNIEPTIDKGLIIIGVDSMEIRHQLSQMFKDKDCYIIDGRMGGLQLEIYCCPASQYETTLVAIGEADSDPCTARSICFNCAVIAGLIVNYVRLFAKKKLSNQAITFLFDNIKLLYGKQI
jgi:molybdopterin/thiamine biosynthesis adenylyltransferase